MYTAMFRSAVAAVLAIVATTWWVALASPAAADVPGDPKAFLIVDPIDLSLIWNADQGENGRGRGEIYVSIWVYWPSRVECTNPQHREYGPLNGDTEFKSGTIVRDPPGTYSIVPATAPVNGIVYYCEADCPVSDMIYVHVFVWESDSNTTLKEYVKTITDAVDSAAEDASEASAALSFVQIITAGFSVLIDLLTQSADDDVGRFSDFVSIPNPCAGPFSIEKSLDLENLCADLWEEVCAEAEDGTEYGDRPYSIDPPANIGKIRLKIAGGPVVNKFSAHEVVSAKQESATSLAMVDIGQPDEATISTVLEVGACIPTVPNGATYAMAIDADNDLATGSPIPHFQGADFLLSAEVGPAGELLSSLLAWSDADQAFAPTAVGLYDAMFDIDRQSILLSVSRGAIGVEAGDVAARGLVLQRELVLSALPELGKPPLAISVNGVPTELPPMVERTSPTAEEIDVVSGDPIRVVFHKAMNREQSAVATAINPPLPSTVTWQGDTLMLAPSLPYEPAQQYQLVVQPFAADTVGVPLDGNADFVPGDPYIASFRTAPAPIPTFGEDGIERSAFAEDAQVFASIDAAGLPPTAQAYLIRHDREGTVAGVRLVDLSSNGPDSIISNDAALLPLGSIAEEGEYHVLIDVDGDGTYDPTIDRIDRLGIGFSVLPDCDGSGEIDAVEIASGTLADSDGDGVPDVCESMPCPADLSPDGVVNAADLAILLGAWGPCRGDCGADLSPLGGDGIVNAADLAVLLGAWGVCP